MTLKEKIIQGPAVQPKGKKHINQRIKNKPKVDLKRSLRLLT